MKSLLRFSSLVTVPLMTLGCLFLSGCKDASESSPKTASDSEVTAVLESADGSQVTEAQKSLALAAKQSLFEQLSGRLMQVMSTQGPVAAIEVCSKEAAKIAKSVGDEHGVKIGRTSLKLRNESNQPPPWAETLITETASEPQFVTLSNGHAAALLPIKLQSQCVLCHGNEQTIAESVKDQLAKLYPNDAATGYQEGDLRGWFWVEMPPG